jgi:hypothetical protein
MHLLKIMLKAGGKQGVPQGGVISPLLSNIYLTEVDRMLERAKEASRDGKYTYVKYARFADDLVILIDAYKRHDWLMAAVEMDVQHTGPLQGLSGCTTSAESRPGRIGPICLEAKQTGERSARKSACCVRRGGGWKRGMVEMV